MLNWHAQIAIKFEEEEECKTSFVIKITERYKIKIVLQVGMEPTPIQFTV